MKQLAFMLALALATTALGAAPKGKDVQGTAGKKLALTDLSAAARRTIEKCIGDGQILTIKQDEDDGETVFSVDARIKDTAWWFTVGMDGALVAKGESVTWKSVAPIIRTAAEKYFGGVGGLQATKVTEGDGGVFSDVLGKKNDHSVTLTYDAKGTLLEETKGDDGKKDLTLSDLPPLVHHAVEKLVGNGKIEGIKQADDDGETYYSVDAKINGTAWWFSIGVDGALMAKGEHVTWESLAVGIRAAAEKYFGSAVGLEATRVVEQDGKQVFDVAGKKDGQNLTVTFDENGTLIEEDESE